MRTFLLFSILFIAAFGAEVSSSPEGYLQATDDFDGKFAIAYPGYFFGHPVVVAIILDKNGRAFAAEIKTIGKEELLVYRLDNGRPVIVWQSPLAAELMTKYKT